jgi:hypothetical protein
MPPVLRLALPLALILIILVSGSGSAGPRALFDNTHSENVANANWIIDETQPIPNEPQSAITWATPETYWQGAISAWGVQLVKRGYSVATLTSAYGISYGNGGNPYDLSNYDVFIVDEPNTRFTSAESTAVFNYVRDGGGLVAISDHNGSDRNNDGFDSPRIWDLLDRHFLFGAHFDTTGEANNNISQSSANLDTSPGDSIVVGGAGTVTSPGIAYHNGTVMVLHPSVNPSVRASIWITGNAHDTTNVMVAQSVYGSGRVAYAGDSSPADDGTASNSATVFNGWGENAGNDSLIFLNATLWATRRANDVTPPTVTLTSPTGGENWKAGSIHAITWAASDNVGVSGVDLSWSSDGGISFPNAIASGLVNSGSFSWTVPNAPGPSVRVRVVAHDAAGNLGADSSAANFVISTWTITASADPGGTIMPSGAIQVAQGASQSFTIAASAGWAVADVQVDGSSVGTLPSYTFTNVSADHSIHASFTANAYTLTVSAGSGGTVAKSPDQSSYTYGTAVQLSATAGGGWAFSAWSGDTSATANPLSLTMTRNRTLAASFADIAPPSVTVTSPVGGEAWKEDEVHAITWTASDNAGVDSVNVDASYAGAAGPWNAIAHGLANSGSYSWTVPQQPTDSAFVRVSAYDHALNVGAAMSDSAFHIVDPNAGVDGSASRVLGLDRPEPNPGHGVTALRFSIPAEGSVRIEILDASGRRLWEEQGTMSAGRHLAQWSGRAPSGTRAGAGLYFVRLVTPWGTRTRRLVWLR